MKSNANVITTHEGMTIKVEYNHDFVVNHQQVFLDATMEILGGELIHIYPGEISDSSNIHVSLTNAEIFTDLPRKYLSEDLHFTEEGELLKAYYVQHNKKQKTKISVYEPYEHWDESR